MTNRIFGRSTSNFVHNNSVPPFNFALKQQLEFAAALEAELQELERHFTSDQCAFCFAQKDRNTAATSTESPDGTCELCTYDDFGLVEGLELDVSWM